MERAAPATVDQSKRWRGRGALVVALLLVILVLIAVLAAVANAEPWTVAQVPDAPLDVVNLQPDRTLGQTFVARHDGLSAVDIALQPREAGDGTITLRLRSDPSATGDLAVATLPAEQVDHAGFYRFSFPAIHDSRTTAYYLQLEYAGEGRVKVARSLADAYLDGAMYRDGAPTEAQTTFRLAFQPGDIALEAARRVLHWLWLLLLGALLFMMPGWALLAWVWPGWRERMVGEKIGLAAGTSLAIYPLLILWTSQIGVHLGALYAWLPVLVAVAALGWQNRRLLDGGRRHPAPPPADRMADLALWAVIALIAVSRLMIGDMLDLPLWGDSVHHTMITQLLIDHDGLFDSWQPYAAMETFTYHFGFHTAAALLHWFGGLSATQAVIWAGQLIGILAALTIYPLTIRIGGNRWAGVFAVLMAGLLLSLPNAFVNWGRYTQLTGQTILPAAVCLTWAAVEAPRRNWRSLAPAILVVAGLAVTHYRVLIFVALLLPLLLFAPQPTEARRRGFLASPLVGRAITLAVIGIGVVVLYLPWFLHVFSGKIMEITGAQLATPAAAAPSATQEYNAIGELTSYLPILVWLALPLCAGWGLWRRERGIVILGLWWLLALLAANPQWLGLPGAGALTSFAVLIAAYIPAAVLLGCAFGWLQAGGIAQPATQASPTGLRRSLAALVVTLLLAFWGISARQDDLALSSGALATSADQRAIEWIRSHTPAEARFLTNAFFAYGNSSIVGSDGGWWLPLLSGRQTTLPPLTYVSERGPRPDYREWINQLQQLINERGVDDPETLRELDARGVSHVYLGQRQGSVNNPAGPALKPETLLASPHFRPIYHQDRVWIFERVP